MLFVLEKHREHKSCEINSLWPSNAIRRQGTESTLAQVMACCLTAPSHYLNLCWLIISKASGIHPRALLWEDLKIPIGKTRLKIAFFLTASRSPRGQWVNKNIILPLMPGQTTLGFIQNGLITNYLIKLDVDKNIQNHLKAQIDLFSS